MQARQAVITKPFAAEVREVDLPDPAENQILVAVGKSVSGWKPGDRVSFPGNHASAELLTIGHERGRLWKLPDDLDFEKAALACILRYGMGASIRAGITLGR